MSSIKNINICVNTEWDKAKTVLMHSPGDNDFLTSIFPKARYYDTPFNHCIAQKEHQIFIQKLKVNGVNVYTVEDILLSGVIDKRGKVILGNRLDKLRNFALNFLHIDTSSLSLDKQGEYNNYRLEVIKTLSPQLLIKIILLNPTIHIQEEVVENKTYRVPKYKVNPISEFCFQRDQYITTRKGIVLGKFSNPKRERETQIANFLFDNLEIKPIYKVVYPGRLEGGDFIMGDNISFIGLGFRTNMDAIQQLMDNDAFGTEKVIIVKDKLLEFDNMHLDTYFNIIASNLVVLAENRMSDSINSVKTKPVIPADIYTKKNGKYSLEKKDICFQNFLEIELGYKIIAVSEEDQKKFGVNFLTIAPNRIIGVEGVSEKYKNKLSDAGVKAYWLDFKNITSGHGGPHCLTQVIERT